MPANNTVPSIKPTKNIAASIRPDIKPTTDVPGQYPPIAKPAPTKAPPSAAAPKNAGGTNKLPASTSPKFSRINRPTAVNTMAVNITLNTDQSVKRNWPVNLLGLPNPARSNTNPKPAPKRSPERISVILFLLFQESTGY